MWAFETTKNLIAIDTELMSITFTYHCYDGTKLKQRNLDTFIKTSYDNQLNLYFYNFNYINGNY